MRQIAIEAFIDFLIEYATWSDHWSLESKITPKIFIDFFEVTSLSLKMILISCEHTIWQNLKCKKFKMLFGMLT